MWYNEHGRRTGRERDLRRSSGSYSDEPAVAVANPPVLLHTQAARDRPFAGVEIYPHVEKSRTWAGFPVVHFLRACDALSKGTFCFLRLMAEAIGAYCIILKFP